MTLTPARSKRPPAEHLLLALITLVALVLRLYQLGFKGFWGDEIWTAHVAALPASQLAERTLPLMLANFIPGPLYYWLAHSALVLFGPTQAEFAMRLPSAIASTLAVPAFYGLARALCGGKVGLIAALLLAVSPYQVWYAQEARFYAWTVLLAILSSWALLRASRAPGRYLAWSGFVAASTASLYNQPIPALAVLLAQAIFLALALVRHRQRSHLLLAAVLSFVAVALLYAPVVRAVVAAGYFSDQPQSVAIAQSSFFAPRLTNWPKRSAFIFSDVTVRFAAAGLARWLFLALSIVGLASWVTLRRWAALALTASFVLATVAVFAIGRPATGYIVRYALFLQPVYLLCVAAGVSHLAAVLRSHQRSQRLVPAVVLALLVVASLMTVAQGYRAAKINDWRAVAAYLERHAQPGDIITGNLWYQSAFSWYWPGWNQFDYCPDSDPLILDELAAGRRVWYVRIGPGDSPTSAALAAALDPVPVAVWGQPGLDYSATFFPVSELALDLLTGGSGTIPPVRLCGPPAPD